MKLLPLSLALVALAGAALPLHATTTQDASANRPGKGLHDLSDPELNALRGRYTIGNNAVAWFGVQMISTWRTASGQLLQGTLAVNMDFSGNRLTPQVSFQPNVSITRPDAVIPMPAVNMARSVDGSGLANVNGVVQSVQVAGDNNLASNVVRLNVRDGGAVPGGSGPAPGVAAASNGDASVSAGFDGRAASVQLDIAGLGSVQQWIRSGNLGQSVQLAADNQAASNLMQIDLIRQSLAGSMQLSQSVAQAINLARGVGNP